MPTSEQIQSSICLAINRVRKDSGRDEVDLQDSHQLTVEAGLDSLDLAQLVVALEKELGVDPFRDGSATARTVGELAKVYQDALS